MILKIVKRKAQMDKGKVTGLIPGEISIFDGFDCVTVNRIEDYKKQSKECYSCSISCYKEEDSNYVYRIFLVNYDNSLKRVIYVDVTHDVYLMSEKGKTVEKLV